MAAIVVTSVGFKSLNDEEIKRLILKEKMVDVRSIIDGQHKICWLNDCTIMSNSWMDTINKTLIFFVSSSSQTIFL